MFDILTCLDIAKCTNCMSLATCFALCIPALARAIKMGIMVRLAALKIDPKPFP